MGLLGLGGRTEGEAQRESNKVSSSSLYVSIQCGYVVAKYKGTSYFFRKNRCFPKKM